MNLTRLFQLPSPTQLKPRERLLAVSSGIVLLIVVMDRLVLNPWLRQAQAVSQQIHSMERTLQHHRQLLARKDHVLAQLGAYQQYLRPVEADELHMASLLKEVEGLAHETHVDLGEIKPLAVEANPLVTRYSLDVQFACALEEWVDFVIRIESSPSLFQVVRASLSVSEDSPGKLKGTLRIMGTTMSVRARGPHATLGGQDATAIR